MRRKIAAYVAALSLLLVTNVSPDSVQVGAAQSSTAVTPATTTVTGCQNRVLYGDNSSILNCEAALGYVASTDSLTAANINATTQATINTTVILTNEAAATLQLGADVNGAAVPQTIKAHDGITGTDIAGANLTVAAGRGTGAGAIGDVVIQGATALATGTTAQTLVTRYQAEGSLRTLSDGVATTVITVTTGNDLSCGGTIFFTVEAADAANQQATSGMVQFAAADNAAGDGGEACAAAITGTNAAAATSGTLTVTADAADGGADLCNIRLTATGSLTETVGPRVRYSVSFNPTSSSCAFTPQ